MKVIDINSINKLMSGEISKDDFLELNNINMGNVFDIIYDMLKKSIKEKNSDNLELMLYVYFKFNLNSESMVELLNNVLPEKWHNQHEDIARLLQKFQSPSSVSALFKTALEQYEYLEYDEFSALAVKCIWGLGDIGTSEACEKLSILSKSANKIISDNAIKQLDRIEGRI